MNIVFTCGGTGGHIYPAIAVARMFRERQPDCRILFIGAEDGMENKLVPREGFRLETLQISSYMRSLKPSAIRHNVRAALSIRRALKKADRIIRDFQRLAAAQLFQAFHLSQQLIQRLLRPGKAPYKPGLFLNILQR